MRKDDGDSNITKLGFFRSDAFYDVSLAKSKQYYNLLIQLKATLSNAAKTLKDKFNMRHEDYLSKPSTNKSLHRNVFKKFSVKGGSKQFPPLRF